MDLRQVGDWLDDELPRMNRAILSGDIPPGMLADQARDILPHLPVVSRLNAAQAQRFVVRLGFAGASVARHYQEWNPGGRKYRHERNESRFGGLHLRVRKPPLSG